MRYFMYCRKSTESDDRQALSIESQRNELTQFAQENGLEIVRVFEESKSAKTPGRPVFHELLERIDAGEAEGIVSWHPDRLARNAVDGGQIIHALDEGRLTALAFPMFSFENNSQGKFMLQIAFGYSKYYVDNLSENVRRGARAKVARGWRPSGAPIGYLNDPSTKETVPDPERFDLIRNLWDDLLAGRSVSEVHRRARDTYGILTRKRRKLGGGPISLGALYKLFGNPFYSGIFYWNGARVVGKHQPMITPAEFDRVQQLLGRKHKPRPKQYLFPYRGLIRCGSCGSAVTAEKTVNPYGVEYTYYHCTWRHVSPRCRERSIEVRSLEKQLAAFLETIYLHESFCTWATLAIKKLEKRQNAKRGQIVRSRSSARDNVERQLSGLTDLSLKDLISDEELREKRNRLLAERDRLGVGQDPEIMVSEFELLVSTIWLRNRAVSLFDEGSDATKRQIISGMSSNISLKSKMLRIEAAKPFSVNVKSRAISTLCASLEDVRTFLASADRESVSGLVSCLRSLINEYSK